MPTRIAPTVLILSLLTSTAVTQTAPSTQPAHDPRVFEPEIAKFEEQDRQTAPPKDPIVFVGSSSIRMWDLKTAFPDLPVLNRGFGGSEISDAVYFAPRVVLKYKPRTIVFYSGDNDIAAGHSADQVAADFGQFLRVVRRELPQTKLIVIGIKPSIARWKLIDQMREANRQIRELLAKDANAVYVDVEPEMLGNDGKPRPEIFKSDGLHMNEQGYAIWNRLIAPHLK